MKKKRVGRPPMKHIYEELDRDLKNLLISRTDFRQCLTCGKDFKSMSKENRICRQCKGGERFKDFSWE